MAKKRNDNEIWGENESWNGDDEGWDYKPPQQDIRSRTAAQRRDFAERVSKQPEEQPSGSRPGGARRGSRAVERPYGDSEPRERDRRVPDVRRDPYRRGSDPRRDPYRREYDRDPYRGNSYGRRPQARSKIVYLYIVTLLAAVVICLFLFAMAFQSITSTDNPIVSRTPSPSGGPIADATDSPVSPMLESKSVRTFNGLIKRINTLPNRLTLLNLDSRRDETFEVEDNTAIKNRYGTAITYRELREGMILEVGYNSQTLALVSLSESTEAWEMAYKTNLKIDLAASTVTIGNEKYTYNSQTLVTYNDEPYPVSQITEMDTVSLTGHGSNIWSMRLEGSHGFLEIENIDAIIDGTLSVGTQFMSLGDYAEPLALAEGPHRVIVEGQNIETFMRDIMISSNETTAISLLEAELKPGSFLVTSSEPESEIFIDGELVEGPWPVEIPFGQHVVRVEKDGYTPVEQVVDIRLAYQELSVDLSKLANDVPVKIETVPSGVEIYIGNELAGTTPLSTDLPVGTHEILMRKQGYNDLRITMDVIDGADNSRWFILTSISSDPTANLPAPTGLQPIIDQPIEDPAVNPLAPPVYPTPTPIPATPGLPVIPPGQTVDQLNPGGLPVATPTPTIPPPPPMNPQTPAADPGTAQTPATNTPIFEEEYSPNMTW